MSPDGLQLVKSQSAEDEHANIRDMRLSLAETQRTDYPPPRLRITGQPMRISAGKLRDYSPELSQTPRELGQAETIRKLRARVKQLEKERMPATVVDPWDDYPDELCVGLTGSLG